MKYIGKEIRRKSLTISGSSTLTVDRGVDSGSTAIYTNNIQNGYPTSNPWGVNLEGSYFNNFDTRRYLLKTVDVPADSTVVIEKPINLGAADKLETQASANDDIDVFASILEIT